MFQVGGLPEGVPLPEGGGGRGERVASGGGENSRRRDEVFGSTTPFSSHSFRAINTQLFFWHLARAQTQKERKNHDLST